MGSLEKKYALTILLVTMVGLAFLVGLQAWEFNSSSEQLREQSRNSYALETERQLKQRGVAFADYLAHNVVTPYIALDMMAVYDLILPVRQSTGVEAIYFIDPHGEILHDGTRTMIRFGEDLSAQFPQINFNLNEGLDHILQDQTSIAVMRTVRTEEKILGAVVVELSTESFVDGLIALDEQMHEIANQSMKRNLSALGFASGGMILLAAVFALLAGRRLAQPITELAQQAERIGLGNYAEGLIVNREDEIGNLATAFDQMRVNLKTQKERIEYQAYYDEMTGLRNRSSFHNVISDTLINSIEDQQHMLIYIDLDGFKRINDNLGHGAGDRLLKILAGRLRQWSEQLNQNTEVCESCELSRWGGDQFAVLVSQVDDQLAVTQALSSLLTELSTPCEIAGIEIVVSASMGYALFPRDAVDSDALITCADLAMFKSKERGRNQISAYSSQLKTLHRSTLTLETEVRQALRDNQFEVLFYPRADTISRAITGVETSLRWNHAERGQLHPRTFLPALQAAGLVDELRLWSFNQSLDYLNRWHSQGFKRLKVILNLIDFEFGSEWFNEHLVQCMERSGLDTRDIVFEIPEANFSKNLVRTSEVCKDLSKYDIKLWIDGFGTGYTSLNRLRYVPIAGIKLHHTIMKGLDNTEESKHLASASLAVANALGMQTAAEGISNETQMEFLRINGCDYVQGSIISPAIPGSDVLGFLRKSSPGPRLEWSRDQPLKA